MIRGWIYGLLVVIGLVALAAHVGWPRLFGLPSAAHVIASGGLKDERILVPLRQFRVTDDPSAWAVMSGANLHANTLTVVSKPFSDIVAQMSGGRPVFFKRGPFAVAVVVQGNDASWIFDRDLHGRPSSVLRALARDVSGAGQVDATAFIRSGGVYVVPEKALLDLMVYHAGTVTVAFVEVVSIGKPEGQPDGKPFMARLPRQIFNGLAPVKFRALVQAP